MVVGEMWIKGNRERNEKQPARKVLGARLIQGQFLTLPFTGVALTPVSSSVK